MPRVLLLFVVSLPLLISACAFVDPTLEGEKVRVLESDEVTRCQLLGKTTSSTKDKIAGVRRHQDVIDHELTSLARNSAAGMGGDTVVAASAEKDGKQTFEVYRCVPSP